jgi:hypothetical protein
VATAARRSTLALDSKQGLAVPAYNASFPVGTTVAVAPRADLEEFRRTWRYHHPLAQEQEAYAGHVARVESIGYYHGGDVLYRLKGLPGIWHEQCLLAAAV